MLVAVANANGMYVFFWWLVLRWGRYRVTLALWYKKDLDQEPILITCWRVIHAWHWPSCPLR